MHYSFPAFFFRTGPQSQCFTPQSTMLSQLDKEGIGLAYPETAADLQNLMIERRASLRTILELDELPDVDKAVFRRQLEEAEKQ